MKSGWFFGTPMWEQYQQAYWAGRTRPEEYKTSPLAPLSEDFEWDTHYGLRDQRPYYDAAVHSTMVIDLALPADVLWGDVRKSYRPLITKTMALHNIQETDRMADYQRLHGLANGGQPRPDATYELQAQWLKDGFGLLVAPVEQELSAAAYWIVYQECAYYASGPSVKKNVQHAVVWRSLEILKARGVRWAELGQVNGKTEKERSVATFKRGFGGIAAPYTVVTRRTA